jgi:hypothetical protein
MMKKETTHLEITHLITLLISPLSVNPNSTRFKNELTITGITFPKAVPHL